MSRMLPAIIIGIVGVSGTIVSFMALAGPFYAIVTTFDTYVSTQGLPNLTSFWNVTSNILKTGYWVVAVLSILGWIIWMFMYAQRQEYVTSGVVYG